MTDQNSQFFAILTAVGEAKQANANALGVAWTFAQMGVGDANNTDPVPSRTQTRLINERRRAPLNQLSVDPKDASIIIAEQVIPPDVGGWWIREIGLYDAAGDLVAVANCAPSYKPLLAQGTGKTQVVRLNLVVTSTANVQLKIDPAVVLATREYVDSSIISVLPKNKVAGTYTKVRINDRGVVQDGSNPTTLAGYGITDAMPKGAGGLLSQAGAVQGRISAIPETRFISTIAATDDRPTGITYAAGLHVTWGGGEQCVDFLGALNGQEEFFVRTCYQGAGTFRKLWTEANFTPALKANLASPTFTGTPRVPNAASGTSTDQVASTKFVMDAMVGKLNVADAQMTGVPTCSTANLGNSSFQVANTEFVQNTLTAKVATQAQVNAGTDDATIVTPKKLRWGFSSSFGTNSYIAFPSWLGGLVIQFGTGPNVTDNTTISFPIAFPTKCLALLEHDRTGTGGATMTFWQFRDVTSTGFNALNIGAYNRNASTWVGASVLSGCVWFAIGY
ncbi:phage tail protein [Pseudomonas putida]|uniref:phage tail protein n=1 Tax=Pseudomonas TaxID=286 RepID=UPI0009BDA99B|nr:phage tail protein [Pseudomonas putida]